MTCFSHWFRARGIGQLIRAKNIKTIGDLSTLTASEIKTLPIRPPKVSNVKKALRVYHEQQVKLKNYLRWCTNNLCVNEYRNFCLSYFNIRKGLQPLHPFLFKGLYYNKPGLL